jgi:uncharacterized membrane protein
MTRSVALCGMVVFHFTYDLVLFGLITPQVITEGFFFFLARAVAGGFLFLAGTSLWLAHSKTIQWPQFWRRWLKLAAAAAVVTCGTWFAMPQSFVFFGILHAIALYSVFGLLFLRLPAILTGLCGVFFILGSYTLTSEMFDHPLLTMIGLSTQRPQTVDFEPIFPWFGPFLLGICFAKIINWVGYWRLLSARPGRVWAPLRLLSYPGRHSLVIYLVHQPILMGCIWVYARMSGHA